MTSSAAVITQLLDEWELRRDESDQLPGTGTHVVAVRTPDGRAAVLKVAPGASHAHLAYRHWAGHGAVELLRADPHRGALLLERVPGPDLTTAWDLAAAEVVGELYGRLHVAAPPQLRNVGDVFANWAEHLGGGYLTDAVPRRLLTQAAGLVGQLTTGPTDPVALLHTNLHYGNVLSAARAPWLAISPRPMCGDPHFELAPMLWHRWEELAGRVRDGVRARFATLVEVAGFDEDRARAWVVVRAVQRATQTLTAQGTTRHDRDRLTICISLAKAVQG